MKIFVSISASKIHKYHVILILCCDWLIQKYFSEFAKVSDHCVIMTEGEIEAQGTYQYLQVYFVLIIIIYKFINIHQSTFGKIY